MKNTQVGIILEGEHTRDAIHVAVAPVIAAHSMMPGMHIGLKDGKAGLSESPIGIVDPFLKSHVEAGQQFYMFLYPGTITSLAHVWSHPAFEAAQGPVTPSLGTVAYSKAWLTDIAQQCGVSYERMIGAIDQGDYIRMGENEQYKAVIGDKLNDLKKHSEVVLGRTLDETPYPFSCSC